MKSNDFPLVGDRKDIQPHKIVEWPGIELAASRVKSRRLNLTPPHRPYIMLMIFGISTNLL